MVEGRNPYKWIKRPERNTRAGVSKVLLLRVRQQMF
jgi:hypothetical protein